jgi:hypothetical protein
MKRAIGRGILWTFIGVYPAALLVGMFFRFPIPMAEYASGWNILSAGPTALVPLLRIPQAVLFYTIFGGFIPLTVLGILAGLLSHKFGRTEAVTRNTRNIALGLAFVPVVALSVLDKFIGPW